MIPAYRHLFYGHSQDPAFRRHGSSGGLGTEILRHALAAGHVEVAAGVGFDPNAPLVPAYRVVTRPDDVLLLAGSKYVHMTPAAVEALAPLLQGKRSAITLQPCHVPLARARYPQALIISFFCGYNMTSEATDYALRQLGVPAQDVTRIDHRGGTYPGGFTAVTRDGRQHSLGKEHYEFLNLCFLAAPCRVCSLYIPPGADIVLGDAWIRGTPKMTVMMTISARGDELARELLQEGRVSLYALSAAELQRMHGHNLRYKQNRRHWLRGLGSMLRALKAHRWAPFFLLGALSRVRRSFAVGIDVKRVALRAEDVWPNTTSR